jgi:hypothetical protein
VRRLKGLGFAIRADDWAAHVVDVWTQIDAMEAERIRSERSKE